MAPLRWTARVIKNEDDDGWAVAMLLLGEDEPALVGPWTNVTISANGRRIRVAMAIVPDEDSATATLSAENDYGEELGRQAVPPHLQAHCKQRPSLARVRLCAAAVTGQPMTLHLLGSPL